MLLSRTSQYAISGILRLAILPPGGFCRVEDLLAGTDAPPHAVAKVFCEMARRGILDSVRGSGGGFRLHESTLSLTLLQIIEAVDGPWSREVTIPRHLSLPDHACPLAALLQPIGNDLERLLSTTTVGDLVRMVPKTTRCCPDASGCGRKSTSILSPPLTENRHEHESTRVCKKGVRGRGRSGGRSRPDRV
jgi:Rrf2 family protein